MKTFEQIQREWNESTDGSEFNAEYGWNAAMRECESEAVALRAQVERLRTAGNAMHKVFGEEHRGFCCETSESCDQQMVLEQWLVALAPSTPASPATGGEE